MRNGYRFELLQVSKNDIRTTGIDLYIRDCKIREVLEASEPDAGELPKASNACEGAQRGNEIGREANRSNGAIDELEGLESGERLEGGEGQSDVVGAVGKAEGEEVAKRLGRVA